MLEVCIFSSCFASCLMSPNLRITVFRGCAFFKIHRLEDGVLSVLLFDCKRGGLYFPLTLPGGIHSFLFFLFGGLVGKEGELVSTVVFLSRIGFRQDLICHHIHTADTPILVHDPVKQF